MSPAIRRIACVLLPVTAALSAAACGGSSPANTASVHVQVARKVTAVPRFVGAGDVGPSRTAPVRARPPQAGTIDDEVNASGAKTLNPCTLVSRSEAQAIVGKPVAKPVDAPQGPTCIYSLKGGKSQITLAVEATHFSKIQPQARLRNRMSVTVRGHTGYCGVAGGPTLIVPLSSGRVLAVTAPCPIAASFAARALGRITAS